jgi:hypothetical protein
MKHFKENFGAHALSPKLAAGLPASSAVRIASKHQTWWQARVPVH